MFRIIQELKPTWIIGENVANFVNMELERTLLDLESEGYETQTFIIPACSVQAFHKRERAFVVAHAHSELWNASKIFARTSPKSKREKQTQWEQFLFINRGANNVEFRKEDESTLCRDDDGIPQGLDEGRIKSLGNAVVPQQIYPILHAIKVIEESMVNR